MRGAKAPSPEARVAGSSPNVVIGTACLRVRFVGMRAERMNRPASVNLVYSPRRTWSSSSRRVISANRSSEDEG